MHLVPYFLPFSIFLLLSLFRSNVHLSISVPDHIDRIIAVHMGCLPGIILYEYGMPSRQLKEHMLSQGLTLNVLWNF